MSLLSVVAVFGVAVGAAFGQQETMAREYTIKAAYIYNFLRYIEWPSTAFENEASPFVVGVFGDAPPDLQQALDFYQKSKTVNGRGIRIRQFNSVEEISDCHILFLTRAIRPEVLKNTVDRFSGGSTLLVGETNSFLEEGGEISFFVASNNIRIRLALKETRRKGLKPSAKLLQVAQVTD